MGIKSNLLALVAGLAFLTIGAWPLGAACFAYLLWSSRGRPRAATQSPHRPRRIPWRYLLAAGFGALSLVALASGGTFSPLVFAAATIGVLAFPGSAGRRFSSVIPAPGTILLRSRYLPARWFAVAEVRPGAEEPPRSLASYSGDLLVFLQSGRIYSISSCHAWGKKSAERALLELLRSSSSPRTLTASLLPLDSASSAELLAHHFKAVSVGPGDLVDLAPSLAGVIRIRSERGMITALSVYSVSQEAGAPTVPAAKAEAEGSPLLWEFLDSVGKRVDWPGPDSLSGVLESVRATRGEPLGERISEIESDGNNVRIQSLGGETAELSRVQLRAIVSIYG